MRSKKLWTIYLYVCLEKKKAIFFLIILKTINQEEYYRKAGFWHAKCEPQKSHFCFRQCKENNSLISEEKLLEDCTLSLSFQLASCQPNQLRDFAKQSITWHESSLGKSECIIFKQCLLVSSKRSIGKYQFCLNSGRFISDKSIIISSSPL